MFACLFDHGYTNAANNSPAAESEATSMLLDVAYCFSPAVEETAPGILVLNLAGCDLLFDSYKEIATSIAEKADDADLKLNIAIANDPDTAIIAARQAKGIVYVPAGNEQSYLSKFSLEVLDPVLAKVEPAKAAEILETLYLWGIDDCGRFAALPEIGLIERLGQDGLRLQKLAKGKNNRSLIARKLKPEFDYFIQLEHPIEELEPLSFVLARLLNQLCASLESTGFATNRLYLNFKLEKNGEYHKVLNLPTPTRDSKTFIRLLLLHLEMDAPGEAILEVNIGCDPTRPRVMQTGLFQPIAPEPDKLEMTLARIANLVGPENIGAPELLDTHRPDAFAIRHFGAKTKRKPAAKRMKLRRALTGFRRFRPQIEAKVQTVNGRPTRISARDTLRKVSGRITSIAGPWRATGDWWTSEGWARDEWDVLLKDSSALEMLYRIVHDHKSEKWYVEGAYD